MRCGATFARNHSRRTIHGFAIAISPVDTVVQLMQIAILIIKINYKIHYIFRSFSQFIGLR